MENNTEEGGSGQQTVSKELATALEALEHELAHGQVRFREAGDGGREGALESLRATVRFLHRIDDNQISDLLQPVYALGWALVQLGDGVRAPMLAQPPKDGRPRDHQEWNAMKALAAMAVTILKDAGRPEREARDYVARALDNAGFKQLSKGRLRPITGATVRTWRQDAMQGNTTEQGSVAAHYRECQTLPAPPEGVSAEAHADQIIVLITRELFMHLRRENAPQPITAPDKP